MVRILINASINIISDLFSFHFKMPQKDYQVLIQTVADLIELLESTAQGIPVSY